jgi:uncharacterized protein YjgD (DUF1641 family)
MQRPPTTTNLGDIAAMLGRMESRLQRIEARLAKLDELSDQAKAVTAVAGDTVDQFASAHELHERVQAAMKIIDRLSRPQTLEQVDKLLETAQMVPTMVVSAADAFDALALAAEKQGVDLGGVIPRIIELLMSSARALQTADGAEEVPAGIFGLLRMLREPETRRTLGVAMHVAKCLSQTVTEDHGPSALPAATH